MISCTIRYSIYTQEQTTTTTTTKHTHTLEYTLSHAFLNEKIAEAKDREKKDKLAKIKENNMNHQLPNGNACNKPIHPTLTHPLRSSHF